MKLKTFVPLILCILFTGMLSCESEKKKQLQAFAETFAGFVNDNQMDSILAFYPTANFDSIASVPSDSVTINENSDGSFKVNFTPNKWLDVKVGEDGSLTVLNSKGLAKFPLDKYELAAKTGMLNDTVMDVRTQELLRDSIYFDWVKEKTIKNVKESLKISSGKITRSGGGATLPVTVTNEGTTPISGASYNVVSQANESRGEKEERKVIKISLPGVDLEPGESKVLTIKQKTSSLPTPKLEYNISNSIFFVKNYKTTGKEYEEYQEYLKNQPENEK